MNKRIGHARIWDFLTKAERDTTLAHAYLFIGPKHVGKRDMANRIAAYLLCTGQNGPSLFGGSSAAKPCQSCDSCKSLSNGLHQDLLVLAKPEEEQSISIEDTRAFLSKLVQSPSLSARKVAIIDEAELMTVPAANAFLKHLEEPTPTTTLLLIAHDKQRLLSTIISRCQTIEFQKVAEAEEDAKELDESLWRQSEGLPGLYFRYKQSPSLAQQALDEQSRLWTLLDMTPGQRLAFLDHLFQAKKRPHAALKQEWDERLALWQKSLQQAWMHSIAGFNPSYESETMNKINPKASMYVWLFDQFASVRGQLHRNLNIRAQVERIFLD